MATPKPRAPKPEDVAWAAFMSGVVWRDGNGAATDDECAEAAEDYAQAAYAQAFMRVEVRAVRRGRRK